MQTAHTASPDSQPNQDQPNQDTIGDPVEIFRKYLVSEWTRQKTPYGLDGALADAAVSEPGDTGRIFLNAGFTAWVAYFLASTGESHYEGRLVQLQAIEAFNLLPIEERELGAKRVAETVPHATVTNAIDKMLRDPKRRRLLSPTSDQESPEQPSSTSPARSISFNVEPLPNPTQRYTTANLDPSQNDIHLASGLQQQVLSAASLQGTADLFPEYMSDAIRVDPVEGDGTTCWKTAVTMSFPYSGKVDCLMSLAIRETKVEYIAMALFKVHVDVDPAARARQVVLEHGVRLVPNPEITLQGVQKEAIIKVLGAEIYEAIKASRVCEEEQQQKPTRATRCVSMIIPSNPHLGAIINLNLSLKGGSRVRDKLYYNK